MKFIKPIVGISKIIDGYDAVICGFNGVLTKGSGIDAQALQALAACARSGRPVVLATNSPLRVKEIAALAGGADFSGISFLQAVVSAGELLHYQLKNGGLPLAVGEKYYNLGGCGAAGIFAGLPYRQVEDIGGADFVFIGDARKPDDTVENYAPLLEHACALGLPLICAGNDISSYAGGEISLGGGAIAEQYAVLGGKIAACGKPAAGFLNYVLESFGSLPQKILWIGDSMATDIKSGNLLNADTLLISKGIHVNFLGEGYIPDVEKARRLAMNFDVYPDYVISGLRW